ncbi:MAG: SRPBCC domain-containing protein [Fibrobacteres bacterium]|jgi:uncharacterized protein YndB with AHSA1/START domain|nr:SRPBCC domain-containing protein [Fibrobacterota bacterium]
MPATRTEPAALKGDREIAITRTFEAPRELVFRAWTEQQHLAQWWGPDGFTITTKTFEFKEGGVWLFTMHGPDGRDYQNKMVFETIRRPERVVYLHPGEEGEGVDFRSVVEFKDVGGKTELSMCMTFDSFQARELVLREHHADQGLGQTMARLGEYLSSMKGKVFEVSRTFDAPRELVWKAYSEAERLKEWWGPKGFGMKIAKLDFRPGGIFHYCMVAPDGKEMWGKFHYREIVKPELMSYVVSFSDAQAGITRHYMSATWPLEVMNITTFTEKDGKTTVTNRGWPINETGEERATYEAAFAGMEMGFKGTLDQLEAYLAKAKVSQGGKA